jgi:hypothetical protein
MITKPTLPIVPKPLLTVTNMKTYGIEHNAYPPLHTAAYLEEDAAKESICAFLQIDGSERPWQQLSHKILLLLPNLGWTITGRETTPEECPDGIRQMYSINDLFDGAGILYKSKDEAVCRAFLAAAWEMQERQTETNDPTMVGRNDQKEPISLLYSPPFTFTHGYIFASGQMFADQTLPEGEIETPTGILRIRGWGYLKYKENPEALQDSIGEYVAALLSKHWGEKIEVKDSQESNHEEER